MPNKEQANKIDALLDNAQSRRFLTRAILKKMVKEIDVPVDVNRTHLVFADKRKKMDYIFADDNFKAKKWGLWEPAFWLWLFQRLQIVCIKQYAILVDFDPAVLLYCKKKWKNYKQKD